MKTEKPTPIETAPQNQSEAAVLCSAWLEGDIALYIVKTGIEGAVCFLRALNRGELSKIVTRYTDTQ